MGERYVNRVGKTDTGPSVGKQPLFIRSKVGTESEGNILNILTSFILTSFSQRRSVRADSGDACDLGKVVSLFFYGIVSLENLESHHLP